MQPELTPLIFTRYIRDGIRFSKEPGLDELARRLAVRLDALIGASGSELAVFMGRIGAGPAASRHARSGASLSFGHGALRSGGMHRR